MARRAFTLDFKTSAAKLVTEQGYTITRAAQSLGQRGIIGDGLSQRCCSEIGLGSAHFVPLHPGWMTRQRSRCTRRFGLQKRPDSRSA